MRSSISPDLYSLFSLTKPTAGIFRSRNFARSLVVMAVISASVMRSAFPAGRSSMLIATWRLGFAAWEWTRVERQRIAHAAKRNIRFMGSGLFNMIRAATKKDTKFHEGNRNRHGVEGFMLQPERAVYNLTNWLINADGPSLTSPTCAAPTHGLTRPAGGEPGCNSASRGEGVRRERDRRGPH